MKTFRTFRTLVKETVQDSQEAKAYLNAALDAYEEDADFEAFLIALRTLVEVQQINN